MAISVSVIIPVYNGAEVIGECLEAVLRQELPRDAYEVLVVDNGSTDQTQAVVRRYPVRLATEAVRSSYAARNTGVRLARGAVLAFTDADCRPSPQWLRAALTALGGRKGRVAGRIEHEVRDPFNPWEQYDVLFFLHQESYVVEGWAATANLVVNRAVFERVGPLPIDEPGDREWGIRASALSIPLWYSPEACVRHVTRKSFRDIVTRLRRVDCGNARLAQRQADGMPLRAHLIRQVRGSVWRLSRICQAARQGRMSFRSAWILMLAWPIFEGIRSWSFCQGWRQSISPVSRA